MRVSFYSVRYIVLASVLFITGCSKDDTKSIARNDETFVMLSATEKWDAGFITSFDQFPSGIVPDVKSQSLQVATAFGFRSYKNWIFARANAAGDIGLQKYTVNADGTIAADGFILNASQFLVYDDHTGFYLDEKRGTMKVQRFDPSTMQRTGEIDLSELRDATISEYQVVGKHTMAAKEGKLYLGITYGTIAAAGYGDDVVDYIRFAVVDIASGKLDKTINYDGDVNSIGWGSSGNKMWTLGDDGALYFYSTGLTNGFTKSRVLRIKAGETDFDKTWTLDANDYGNHKKTSIATGLVKNGKFYFELASEDLQPDYSNLQNFIFDYYVLDMSSGIAQKITGMPKHHYAYASEQAITEIDGTVYYGVRNIDEGVDAYYKLNTDGSSATQAFNVDHDGFMWGFVKLSN